MNLVYLTLVITNLFLKKSLCEVLNEADEGIIDIDIPKNHLSQYFNNLRRFTKKLNETSNGFYKDFLSSEDYDRSMCWGYEYECKKPLYMHRCPGNHSGYVKSKQDQLDVFYAQADFGNNFVIAIKQVLKK